MENKESILDIFDVNYIEHIKEYKSLTETGMWKADIFKEAYYPLGWQLGIASMLADEYIKIKLSEKTI